MRSRFGFLTREKTRAPYPRKRQRKTRPGAGGKSIVRIGAGGQETGIEQASGSRGLQCSDG